MTVTGSILKMAYAVSGDGRFLESELAWLYHVAMLLETLNTDDEYPTGS